MWWIIEYLTGLFTFLLCSIGVIAMGVVMALLAPIITIFIIDK